MPDDRRYRTPRPCTKKVYLGDSVYMAEDAVTPGIVLTTEDGIGITNQIVLGPTETWALLAHLTELGIITEWRH